MIDFTKIENALVLLLSKDAYLLENDISERSITHKLGEYLQDEYADWNVDCEFNKNLDSPKNFEIKPEVLLSQMASYIEDNFNDEYNGNHIDVLPTKEERRGLVSQLKNPKNLKFIKELELYFFILKIKGKRNKKKTIYPDIIIHRRGTTNNRIVIEAKKSKNKNKISRFYDMIKLATLVSSPDYNYNKGVFIDIPVDVDFNNFIKFNREQTSFQKIYEYLPSCNQ